MPEPLAITAAAVGAVEGLIKVIKGAASFLDIPKEVNLLSVNVNAADRVLSRASRALEKAPAGVDSYLIQDVQAGIEDTEKILMALTKDIEACHKDIAKNKSVSFTSRTGWVLGKRDRFILHTPTLIGCLSRLDASVDRLENAQGHGTSKPIDVGSSVDVAQMKLEPIETDSITLKNGDKEVLLIGVDIGTKDTAVSYFLRSPNITMREPRTIQKWPGNVLAPADRVPTAVAYRHDGVVLWGFQTQDVFNEEIEGAEVHDWFAIYLDKLEHSRAYESYRDMPPLHEDVRKYFRDFLHKLYLHIRISISSTVPSLNWEQWTIEFLFSPPTIWNIDTVEDMCRLAREAGFGSESGKHSVVLGVTEAEATAVYSFSTQAGGCKTGDLILVVDAGEAMTDLALLKTDSNCNLRQLDTICGYSIGSLHIDMAFERLAFSRLKQARTELTHSLDDEALHVAVHQMAQREFQLIKKDFGTEGFNVLYPEIQVPGLSINDTSVFDAIENGKMFLSRSEIKAMFDHQLERLFTLIDDQLHKMAQLAPNDLVKFMVLSGKLSESEHVVKRINSRYRSEKPHVFAPEICVIPSRSSNVAVVTGLLIDRERKLDLSKTVVKPRKCRQSLGVVCDQIYDESRHRGAKLYVDPTDGLTYATAVISWLVKQGDVMEADFVEQEFYRYIDETAVEKVRRSQFVICNSRSAKLPMTLHDANAELLGTMTWKLTNVDMRNFEVLKRPSRRRLKRSKFYKVLFKFRISLHVANIEVDILFNDGVLSSPIERDWEWKEKPEKPEKLDDGSGEQSRDVDRQ